MRKFSKQKILYAAANSFARTGYHGTSIRDISKVCGLRQPSIYHHFQNKENLFKEALRYTLFVIIRVIRENTVKGISLRAELLSYFFIFSEWGGAQKENSISSDISLVFDFISSAPAEMKEEFHDRITAIFDKTLHSTMIRYADDTPESRIAAKVFRLILFGYAFTLRSSASLNHSREELCELLNPVLCNIPVKEEQAINLAEIQNKVRETLPQSNRFFQFT